jgi:hypothetical protein
MRQHRRAGEKLFIDFAGLTVALSDGSRAQISVAAMAVSSFVFACATLEQRLEDWIACMGASAPRGQEPSRVGHPGCVLYAATPAIRLSLRRRRNGGHDRRNGRSRWPEIRSIGVGLNSNSMDSAAPMLARSLSAAAQRVLLTLSIMGGLAVECG